MRRMRTVLAPSSLLMVVALATGCPPPFYSSDIGRSGVPTDPGSLAGTWAMVMVAADEVDVPLVGKQYTGGMSFTLTTRTWDGESYDTRLKVCRVVNFEVAGTTSEIQRKTARAIPEYNVTNVVDHGIGEFGTKKYQEVWAIEGIGLNDDFPTNRSDSRTFDMEEDDHPGATVNVHGLAEGDLYFAQRKIATLDGIVASEDETMGLVKHKKEALQIDATDERLLTTAPRVQYPDPLESWFHEVRIDDDADCDDVEDGLDDGSISQKRPFDGPKD